MTASNNALSSAFRTSPGVPTSTQPLLLQVFPGPQLGQVTTLPQPSFAFPHVPEQAATSVFGMQWEFLMTLVLPCLRV